MRKGGYESRLFFMFLRDARYDDFRKKLYNNEYSVTEVERKIAQSAWSDPQKVTIAEQWLREQREDKGKKRLDRQEGREEESLRLATETNDIAKKAMPTGGNAHCVQDSQHDDQSRNT